MLLFEALNRQTLTKVKKTGLPFFHCTEEDQIGETFGERYTNAIEKVYAEGFNNVITIGNDTPNLKSSQLLETAKKLEDNAVVLGPSKDGGYYLMGLQKSQFNKERFLKLPWQTSALTKCISRLLSAKKIEVVFLKVLQDIDSILDVKNLVDSFKKVTRKLLVILRIIITDSSRFFSIYIFSHASFQKKNPFNKGSPLSI